MFEGTLGTLGGVGGTAFILLGLMRFVGVSQRESAGCSLFAITTEDGTSSATHVTADTVVWSVAGMLAGSAAVCTPIGVMVAYVVPYATLWRLLPPSCSTARLYAMRCLPTKCGSVRLLQQAPALP